MTAKGFVEFNLSEFINKNMIKYAAFFLFLIFFFLFFVFLGTAILRGGQRNVSLKEVVRDDLKNIILEMKEFIYLEATRHNPPGDIVPDNLDNKIKNEIKERI